MGIRYELADGRAASFGTMLQMSFLSVLFWLCSFGICVLVDVCKVLGSEQHQGITASMYAVYPRKFNSRGDALSDFLR